MHHCRIAGWELVFGSKCVRHLKFIGGLQQTQKFVLQMGVLLLHNNMHSHSTAATIEAFRQLKHELTLHPHIVQTQLHQIITCLNHYKKLCRDESLPVMKLVMWCKCGFDHNWKLALRIGSEGLWTATWYTLRRGTIVLSNDTLQIFMDYYTWSNL